MPSYRLSSTRLGSTIKNLTSSGVARKRMLTIIEFRQTLLPVLVAPAMSRCGMRCRSATRQWPEMSLPNANASGDGLSFISGDSRISLTLTKTTLALGTSMR